MTTHLLSGRPSHRFGEPLTLASGRTCRSRAVASHRRTTLRRKVHRDRSCSAGPADRVGCSVSSRLDRRQPRGHAEALAARTERPSSPSANHRPSVRIEAASQTGTVRPRRRPLSRRASSGMPASTERNEPLNSEAQRHERQKGHSVRTRLRVHALSVNVAAVPTRRRSQPSCWTLQPRRACPFPRRLPQTLKPGPALRSRHRP